MKILQLLAVGLFLAEATRADDLDDASFGLRFQATLTRFSRYPDVAGVAGASAAAEWGSSTNPAGLGWAPLEGVSPQYSLLDFENGTDIHVFSVSYAVLTEESGVFQPSLGYAASNSAPTLQGPLFEYDALFAELQWAIKPSEKTAIGVNLNFADSVLSMSPGFKSDAQTYGIRLGGLFEVAEKFRLGVAIDYSVTPSSTSVVGVGLLKDTLHQILVRTGIAWEYAERSRVYLDYQYGHFRDDTGSLGVHRVYLGVDHMLAPFLAGRVGTVVDNFGNTAFSIGVGIFPSEHVFIDIAYQYFMFPEVELEFGRSHGFAFSISVAF